MYPNAQIYIIYIHTQFLHIRTHVHLYTSAYAFDASVCTYKGADIDSSILYRGARASVVTSDKWICPMHSNAHSFAHSWTSKPSARYRPKRSLRETQTFPSGESQQTPKASASCHLSVPLETVTNPVNSESHHASVLGTFVVYRHIRLYPSKLAFPFA